MTKQIIIEVDATGEITLKTEGYTGKSCVKDSQFVKDLLGTETHRALTPTYYEENEQKCTKYLTLCG